MAPYVPAKIERIAAAVQAGFKGKIIVVEDLMTISADGEAASARGADDGEDAPGPGQRSGPMQRMRERLAD